MQYSVLVDSARKSIGEMIGEASREVAVLIFVFAPLDRWVERRPYTLSDILKTIAFAGIFFVSGVMIERMRN